MISEAFISGFLRCFNLLGNRTEWPDVSDGRKKDYEALKSDWEAVGKDLRGVINYENKSERYRPDKEI